jgi:sortase A
MKNTTKRKLGWLEAGLYLGGIALLAVFFQIRADGERKREEGVQAFNLAASAPASEIVLENPYSGQSTLAQVATPNQALWTEKRIADYEESLKVAADPPVALLTIAHLDIQVPVYNGSDDFNMNRGVGRIIGTAPIDTAGNLGIAGHRDGFFRGLKDIEVGDHIDLQTAGGEFVYAVSSIQIVDPDDVSVLDPTAENTITLVTCYPFYYVGHAPKRYIVKATAKHVVSKT